MGSKTCNDESCSKGNADRRKSNHFLTPDSIADYAVFMFLFTVTGTYLIGVSDVLPFIYKDSGSDVVALQRVFVTVLFVEIMMNWLCIRYVDSSYSSYKELVVVDEEEVNVVAETNSTKLQKKRRKHSDGRDALSESEVRKRLIAPSKMDFSNMKKNDQNGQTVVKYSYWSWAPCFPCDVMRPPRCHHCPKCDKCILKRDHHCYFSGSCVGWKNERFFFVFCFWAALSCAYALIHAVYYAATSLEHHWRWFDLFPPLTILRCLLGHVSPTVLIYVSVTCFLFYFVFLSTNFLLEHLLLMKEGLTSFESEFLNRKSLTITDNRTYAEKMRAVFGCNWALSILIPLHPFYPTLEDPVNWPSISVNRRRV